MKPIILIKGVLIVFYLLSQGEVIPADWKFIEKDDEGFWFYDAETVERFPDYRTRVRTKKNYERNSVLAAKERYGKGYEALDHVVAEWEIDCFHKRFKLHSAIFYSKEKVVIERYLANQEEGITPEEIPCDSYLELLLNKVCD